MKSIVFLIPIVWNINAYGQSVILADLFQSPPSNSNFYYKNAGQVLAKDKLKILDGPNSFQLNLSQMPTGVYYLHLSANDYSGDIKLIKN